MPAVASNAEVTGVSDFCAVGSTMGSYWSAHEVRLNSPKAEDDLRWVCDWDSGA